MVNIDDLSPGMRLKIVDSWNSHSNENSEGLMDKYLGLIVTILKIDGRTIYIEEDSGDCEFQWGGHWAWNSYCFDYIVDSNEPDFEPSSESEILSFIFKE